MSGRQAGLTDCSLRWFSQVLSGVSCTLNIRVPAFPQRVKSVPGGVQLVPALGGLVSGLIGLRLAPEAERHGTTAKAFATRRSICARYCVPCTHSFGSIIPRFSTTSNLPLRAWAMYMFIRT